MIDTIWLILHHSTVNYKIDFMAEVGAKINVDIKRSNEYRIVGSLQNMQIYIEPTFVLIQGSLPKYYYGSNLVSLPRTEYRPWFTFTRGYYYTHRHRDECRSG